MASRAGMQWLWALALTLATGASALAQVPAGQSTADAGLGQYRIDEPHVFRQAIRRSVYIPMRDGVRLAVDVYLPVVDGKPARGRFPTVIEYTRYGRSKPLPDGGTVRWPDAPADARGVLQVPAKPTGPLLLLAYGYAVAVIDMRGSGASFGPSHGEGDDVEGRDGFDAIGWIARQPWSDGTVGMIGGSYLAEVQPRVAAERPKALKALSMNVAFFDGPNGGYAMGGVYRDGWINGWSTRVAAGDNRTTALDGPITNIAQVDADPQQVELRRAIDEHKLGGDSTGYSSRMEEFRTLGVLRDRIAFIDAYQATGENNLLTIVDRVNRSRVPALLFGGWHDIYPNDMLYWFANLTTPRKLIFGPYAHGSHGPMPNDPRDIEQRNIIARETLRWFDRWLLGKRNGAEDRPAVHYGLQRTPERTDWFTASTWPPRDTGYRDFPLSARSAGSVQSQNDGSLALQADATPTRQPWIVDYSTTTGDVGTRWLLRRVYEVEMASNDMKSLTYTSPPLQRDLHLAGVPVVKLQLSSDNARDADVYAYLSVVQPDGSSRLLTEGILRASHRTLGKAPYDNFGLPFPTSASADVLAAAPLSSTPVTLEFAMLAIGRIVRPGERLRLTISGADRGNTVTPEQAQTPRLGVHVGGNDGSVLRLPVLGNGVDGVFPVSP